MEKRLQNLTRLWPPDPCPDCRSRPAIVCIAHADDPAPDYPEGRCPACGRILYSVPVLIGVDCDAI
jgi:hypothetical protein